MAGLALDGKPIQTTKPPSSASAIPLVVNGIHQSTSKHRFVTFRTSGIHAKPGTSSYTVSCTKTPPTVITQQIHHDDTSYHTRNLPKLQKNGVIKEQQVLLNHSEILPNVKPHAQPSLYPPDANHNLTDQPHGPTNRLCTPYRPPPLKKSTSPTILPPSTSTRTQTTTQPPSQKKCIQFQLQPFAVTPNHASATQNQIHITTIPANEATDIATNHPHLPPQTSQLQAITAHLSTSQPTTFDSSHHFQPQPINQHTACPRATQQTNPVTCSPNYTNGDCPTSCPCPTPSHNETIHPAAPVDPRKHHQVSPTTMPSSVSNCAPHSLLSKDHPNPILALKEAVFNLTEALNRLCTTIIPMPNIVRYDSTTESFPRKLHFTIRDTPYTTPTYDTIQPRTLQCTRVLPDIYNLLIALPAITYDRLTRLPQEPQQTLTGLSYLRTHSSLTMYSSHSVYHTDSYRTSTSDTLRMHLQYRNKYTKDLWKSP